MLLHWPEAAEFGRDFDSSLHVIDVAAIGINRSFLPAPAQAPPFARPTVAVPAAHCRLDTRLTMAAQGLPAKPSSASSPSTHPLPISLPKPTSAPFRRRLLAVFCVWKLFLFFVAAVSPGPGYDSSTDILFRQSHLPPSASPLVQHLLTRLSRWDAIYFTTSASRGHLYEQEWAFSWLLARAMAATSAGA